MEYSDLSKFLENPERYSNDYLVAKDTGLLDFQMILLWKTFILFIYEKISNVRRMLGDDVFLEQYWCKGSLKSNDGKGRYHLDDFDNENIYSYSNLQDDELVDLVCRVFGLEKNFKQLLNTIKNDRHTAAHVSSEIIATQDSTITKNLNDLARITAQVDSVYKNKFITNDTSIEKSNNESEINYFIDNFFLEKIMNARNFDEAEELMRGINKKMRLLSKESIKKILYAMLQGENNGGYIQSIDLGYAYHFIDNLLKESYKKNVDLVCWKNFYIELDHQNQKRFYDVRKSLEKHGIQFNFSDLKYFSPEDIPF